MPCSLLVPGREIVVMSPSCANSAVLLIELTLISSTDSIDGNTLMPSAPMPLRRTLVVRMPSTETSV